MNRLAVGATLAVLSLLLVTGAAMKASVMVVDVKDPDAPRILVPVPLAVAQLGVNFTPRQVRQVRVPELADHMPDVRRIVDAMRELPDADFVAVEGRDEHVLISKEGDAIRIHVLDGDRTRVELTVPLGAVAGVLDSYDEENGLFRTRDLISALRSSPRGNLVHVVDGDTEVRIRMW